MVGIRLGIYLGRQCTVRHVFGGSDASGSDAGGCMRESSDIRASGQQKVRKLLSKEDAGDLLPA